MKWHIVTVDDRWFIDGNEGTVTNPEVMRATLQPRLRAGESDPRDDQGGNS